MAGLHGFQRSRRFDGYCSTSTGRLGARSRDTILREQSMILPRVLEYPPAPTNANRFSNRFSVNDSLETSTNIVEIIIQEFKYSRIQDVFGKIKTDLDDIVMICLDLPEKVLNS